MKWFKKVQENQMVQAGSRKSDGSRRFQKKIEVPKSAIKVQDSSRRLKKV